MRRLIAVGGGLAVLFLVGVLAGIVAKPSAAPVPSLAPTAVSKVGGVKVPSLPEPVAVVSLRPAPVQPSKSQTTSGASAATSTTSSSSVVVGSGSNKTTPTKSGDKGSGGSGEVISSGSGG